MYLLQPQILITLKNLKIELMTLISAFPPATTPLTGNEEYILRIGGTEYKTTGDDITQVVSDALAAYILSNDAQVTALQGNRVLKAGDTMTGYLTANADPINALHYSTKQYVDTIAASKLDDVAPVLDAAATATTAAATNESTLLSTTAYVGAKIKQEIYKKTAVASTPFNITEDMVGRIKVDHTAAAPTTLNLPQISSLSDPERIEYVIFDSGLNAELNKITIVPFAGDTINGITSLVLGTDGESTILATAGGTSWFITDKVSLATETDEGLIRKATTAESIAMTDTSVAVTPARVQDILQETVYNSQEINAAATVFAGSDGGTKYITYSGARTITLPDPTALDTGIAFSKSIYEITNLNGTSGNTTTITAAGGATINGAANFVIPADLGAGTTFVPTSSGWVTKADTASAINIITAANPLTTLTLDIGDWDMDADTTKTVSHGLSATEWKTIRSVNTIIRNDVDAIYYKLESLKDFDGYLAGGTGDISSTKVFLNRRLLGHFDSVNFDSTSYNRGWITLEYTPD